MRLDSTGFFLHPRRLILVGLLLLAGCAPRVYVEQDQAIPLAAYHHFAWLNPPPAPVHDPILDSQIMEDRVQRAVLSELTARGFLATGADHSPDFLVTYHTASKEKLDSSGASFSLGIVDAFPHGFGSVFIPVAPDVHSREEGTLMIDIIDGKSKRLVWRGWTSGWVNQDSYTEAAVTAAVQQILARFPAQ